MIGNSVIEERPVEMAGPAMQLSDAQKLVLVPVDDHTDMIDRDRIMTMAEDDAYDDESDKEDNS